MPKRAPDKPRPRYSALWRGFLSIGAVLALLLPGTAARAHPHVWIDVELELRFEGEVLTGMRVVWVFDEYYSAFAVQDFDTNGNKQLDPEELAVIDNGHQGLGEYSYFTHMKIGDLLPDKLPVTTVENFKASMKGDRLIYAFDVPLPADLEPRKTTFGVGFYDPTYYIDLNLGALSKPRVTANWPGSCRPTMAEDAQNPIYFGMVNPLYLQIGCDVS